MFEKRVTIFKKRDRATWQQIRDALKKARLPGVRAGHYLQETVMAGGCGAKLDPRDFGGHGKIDRDIYWIKVKADDEQKARDILRQNGLVPVIEDQVLKDAALRKRSDLG